MDVFDQLLGVCPGSRLFIGRLGRGNGGDRSLVVKAVQIATGLLKLADPFMRLLIRQAWLAGSLRRWKSKILRTTNLHNHHVTIESAGTILFGGTVDATTNMRDNGTAEGHVGHEVTVHDIDMEPIGALFNFLRTVMAQVGEVGTKDRGGDNSGR